MRKNVKSMFLVFVMSLVFIFAGCSPTNVDDKPKTEEFPALKMSEETASMPMGTEKTLTTTGGNGSVIWFSSKESVAIVSSTGKVAAIGIGAADIMAKSGEDIVKCVVTVVDPLAGVIDVSIKTKTVNLYQGLTYQLDSLVREGADVISEGATITWASSDNDKATVSSAGLVTAKAKGEVDITVTVLYKGKTVTDVCSFNILTLATIKILDDKYAANIGVKTSIKFDGYTIIGDEFVSILAKDVTFTSSNAEVVQTHADGSFTGITKGEATITATYGDYSDTCLVKIIDITVVRTAEDLERMPKVFVGEAILMDNIDLKDSTFTGFTSYTGKFYGNGYAFKNLTLNVTGPEGVSFFGVIGAGDAPDTTVDFTAPNKTLIKNLSIMNITIVGIEDPAFPGKDGILGNSAPLAHVCKGRLENVIVEGRMIGDSQHGVDGFAGVVEAYKNCNASVFVGELDKAYLLNVWMDVKLSQGANTYVKWPIVSGSGKAQNVFMTGFRYIDSDTNSRRGNTEAFTQIQGSYWGIEGTPANLKNKLNEFADVDKTAIWDMTGDGYIELYKGIDLGAIQ